MQERKCKGRAWRRGGVDWGCGRMAGHPQVGEEEKSMWVRRMYTGRMGVCYSGNKKSVMLGDVNTAADRCITRCVLSMG